MRFGGTLFILIPAATAALVAIPSRADARPEVFAEGMIGVSIAIGNGGYTEDHQEAAVQTGVRGGVWFAPGRIESRTSRRGRQVGLEAQIDRTEYGASYFYYTDIMNPDGTMSTIRVDPTYSRTRALAGVRVAMPMHRRVDLILRAAGGLDRVTGTIEEIAPVLEIGFQLSLHLGPVRIGAEWSLPVAFHDAEEVETSGIGPQFGHRPGYGRAVDGLGWLTLGAVF